jgi:hypothetical protein
VVDAKGLACLLLLAAGLCPLPGQAAAEISSGEREITEPEALIGLTLEGIYAGFGVPREVYALRGEEVWQDDVVLVYPQGDFYVFRDRVWQVGIPAIRGIRVGDSRDAVILALGEEARAGEDCFLLPILDRPWPTALRVDIGSAALVTGIFVYRSDL